MALSSIGDDGSPVDWWFAYKLPDNARAPKGVTSTLPPTTGYEYLYYQPGGKLALSAHRLDQSVGALAGTLGALFGEKGSPAAGRGWILYNDEIPGHRSNDGTRGHTKGVLGFDLDEGTAIWLLHSTPRYPHPADPSFPENEKIYGQTFLCVTLADLDTAESLAGQMVTQQQPQTYGCHVPSGLDAGTNLHHLSKEAKVPDPADPSDFAFKSRAGMALRCIAKNRHWGGDFWIDLVGPALEVDLRVESWRRGRVPPEDEHGEQITDIQYVSLAPLGIPYEWHYTKDHAKWATSTTSDWVCVADINRMVSQEKRGGGSICFQDKKLWAALSSTELLAP